MSLPELKNLVDEDEKTLEQLQKEDEEMEKKLKRMHTLLQIKHFKQSIAEKKQKFEDGATGDGCDSGASGGGPSVTIDGSGTSETTDSSGPNATTNDGDEYDKIIAEASKENERLEMELKKQKAAQILQSVNEKKRKLQHDDDDGGARARGGAPVQEKCRNCRVTSHTSAMCTHRISYCVYCRKEGHHIEICMRKRDSVIPPNEQKSMQIDDIMRLVKLNNEFQIHKEMHGLKKQQ